MLEKGKISAFQMGLLSYPMILGTAILILPAITGKQAERDLWISPILSSLIGYLMVYTAIKLHKIFPGETIMQYNEHILGRILGKIFGFFFLFFSLHNVGNVIREYADFVVGSYLPKTPLPVVISSLILLCAFAVHGGIEVLGRLAQIYIPLFIFPIILMIFFLLGDYDPKNMFPIMRHGIMPSVRGAVLPGLAWFTEFIYLSFLLPYLTDQEKGKKWGMISVFVVTLTMVVANLMILFLFGGTLTSVYLFPVFEASRYIAIADFFEHLESVVLAIWVAGIFIKVCVFYYAISLGTAQWLNMSDYRPVVYPYALIMTVFGILVSPNSVELTHYFETALPFYNSLFLMVIPLCLLLLAMIKKKIQKKGER